MSILGGISQGGGQQKGQRIVIAAQEKVGKTTLAMGAPNALLIPLETDNVALSRYRHVQPNAVATWAGILALCEELRSAAKRGQIQPGATLVWDSATALERVIHTDVMATDPDVAKALRAGVKTKATMESVHGGYGKAYQIANTLFEQWSRYMDELATYGGINVVLTCHVFASRIVDPSAGEFDTWDLLLHSPKNNKTYGKREFVTQWADLIGFLHEPIFVQEAATGKSLSRGISANQGRVLEVDRTPAWVAGNRYGLSGTVPIPLVGGWNTLAHAIYTQTGGAIDLFNREKG